MAGVKVSPIIKGVMKLTRNDFSTLINKAIKLLKIDTNGFYNKKQYLAEVDTQAKIMLDTVVDQKKTAQGITKKLKE